MRALQRLVHVAHEAMLLNVRTQHYYDIAQETADIAQEVHVA